MERRTRVRFAPSPTGPLHMGGVRTALYNYLYAKQRGGDFIIRIEDTDSHRFVPGAEEYIIEALNWCGIIPDEGVDENGKVVETPSERHPHAPYRQSQRRGIYKQYADQLIASGNAYYAFDSSEELDAKRAECEAAGQTFIYNQLSRMSLRNSLTLPAEETERLLRETTDWTIRFKMPQDTVVKMDDLIRGHVEINTDTLDDKVLWKRADELPTYHLANIVDDHLMEITEVIRGEEWLPSLPLHYLLYKAFGWEETQPRFAHLPLLLKPVGNGKLSKRDGDKMGFPVFPLNWINSEGETYHGYREDGYFPEAFVNLLAMLGWNPGTEQEIFSMKELIDSFSIDKVSKSGAKFNPEKARWFNKEYLRMRSDEDLASAFLPVLESKGIKADPDYVKDVISFTKERATFVTDFWTIASYLFVSPKDFEAYGIKAGASVEPQAADNRRQPDPRAKVFDDTLTAPFLAKDVDKFWKPEIVELVLKVSEYVNAYDGEWSVQAVGAAVEDYIRTNEWPMGKVMNALRLALAGSASGLGIADIIARIGKGETASRIAFAASRLS
ncbi:MAG: glutamate--tRNA ligase [Bacteroidales bacterium]|nr:glutamate--tRNA ligase [Candidatus Cryptobacteroides faecihippi]MCQ2161739.1 glutamate--tRNA ligase [Bacteroidales bacterium]